MLTQSFYSLEVPPAPAAAPEYLDRLLARLQAAVETGAARPSRDALRDVIGFLTRYFATVLESSVVAAPAQQRPDAYRSRLLGLLSQGDPRTIALRSVFFREDRTRGGWLPYPHTRLLARDGCLVNGARTLSEWLANAQAPDTEEECREEVSSLLPVLSQWLTAASSFFQECRYDYLELPSTAAYAATMRGLEGGRRLGHRNLQLVTRFLDYQTGLPLRLRDIDFDPTPVAEPEAPTPSPFAGPVAVPTTEVSPFARPEEPTQESSKALDTVPLATLVGELLTRSQVETSPAATRPAREIEVITDDEIPMVTAVKEEVGLLQATFPLAAAGLALYFLLLHI